MFYDDEGYSEWICETDPQGNEHCYDDWIEPPEPPEVDNAFIVAVPAVGGAVEYSASDDAFRFSDLNLGDATTIVSVDGDTIVSFDLNPDDGRTLGLAIRRNEAEGIGFAFSPSLDAQVGFEWHKVISVFEDLPSFLLDETIGARMEGSIAPTLDILRGEDTQVRVTSGRLNLWSTGMSEDVVIEEGECIIGIDEDTLTEAERDALHDLFGGLLGATCEN
jgi:hypothetical protein